MFGFSDTFSPIVEETKSKVTGNFCFVKFLLILKSVFASLPKGMVHPCSLCILLDSYDLYLLIFHSYLHGAVL